MFFRVLDGKMGICFLFFLAAMPRHLFDALGEYDSIITLRDCSMLVDFSRRSLLNSGLIGSYVC